MTSDHFGTAAQLSSEAGLQFLEMKTKFNFVLLPALACFLQLAPAADAQPRDHGDRPFRNERRARWANLSADERERLRSAHEKAMADPAVQAARDRLRAARREFREVMRPALLKADPTIQPILDKLRPERADR